MHKNNLNCLLLKKNEKDDTKIYLWHISKMIRDKMSNTCGSKKQPFCYVDLFAGMGGFHQAMRFLNGKCVMASEIDPFCQEIYRLNFPKTKLEGDIRNINPCAVDNFTVLCAGFPCQPFSKAGEQKGFDDTSRGDLFHHAMSFVRCNPSLKFIIMENVRNLADKEDNWNIIKNELKSNDFIITEEPLILSPNQFGIPQTRERVFILGIRKDIADPEKIQGDVIRFGDLHLENKMKKCLPGDALTILDSNVPETYVVPEEIVKVLRAWEILRINTFVHKIGAPIWICAFGLGIDDDENYRQSVGYYEMPEWKQRFYNKNREFYLTYREYVDNWVVEYDMLNRSKLLQKFEWNCGNEMLSMKDTIIQIRQSGIRCKRQDFFPSLVAMSNTPFFWDDYMQAYRYLTPHEAAKLQSFHGKYKLIGSNKTLYHQLGNSVNVRILKIVGESLFNLEKKSCRKK